ncbi:MAG: hypothetical protein ACRED1_01030 [Limisphaerales bacterium]
MDKKNTTLIAILLVLVLGYVIFFTDWFRPRVIHLFYTTRPVGRFRARPELPYILFGLEGRYRLTEITVVSLDGQKRPEALPLWRLISDSNSVPIKIFIYGEHIYGMRPATAGDRPLDLVTNQTYRLLVRAGRAKGQIDFNIK